MQPRIECAGGELLMACAPTGAGLSKVSKFIQVVKFMHNQFVKQVHWFSLMIPQIKLSKTNLQDSHWWFTKLNQVKQIFRILIDDSLN